MEELLARLRELQKQQQQLNEQMAGAQQPGSSQGQAEPQQSGRPQNAGTRGGPVAQRKGGEEGDPSAGPEGEQRDEGGQGDEQLAASDGSRANSLSESQQKLGQRTGEAAEEVAEMPMDVGKSHGKSQVASELRRASEYQSKAAQDIAAHSFGDAQQSGSEGAASIAEAIAQLEDLVFAEGGGRNEPDSFPPGYENLIQEYLRAISYE